MGFTSELYQNMASIIAEVSDSEERADFWRAYRNLSETDQMIIAYITVENMGKYIVDYDLDDVIGHVISYDEYQHVAREEFQDYIFEDIISHELPDHLSYYFDIEAYCRDLEYGGDVAELGDKHMTIFMWTNF